MRTGAFPAACCGVSPHLQPLLRTLLWVAFLFGASSIHAAALDSLVVVGGAGIGPFVLGDYEIDSTSLVVVRAGDTLDQGIEFRFLPQENALLLEDALSPGQILVIRYRKSREYLPKIFSRRKIAATPQNDSTSKGDTLKVIPSPPVVDTSGAALQVGGVKSFGISASNTGGLTLQQSLQVQVEGKLSRQTRIRAVLSDQNLPLQPEGSTAVLGEIEQARIDITNPGFTASLGGFPISEQLDYIRYAKRIQGATGSAMRGPWKVTLSGANSRGMFQSSSFKGEDGRQGPYRLPDRNGSSPVTVLAGTETVWLDGQRLARGEGLDYVIDYSFGTITFGARRMISAESDIMVHYEYLEQRYERFFLGGSGQFETPSFSARVTGLQETDSRDQPLEFALGEPEKAALSQAGDNPELARTVLLPFISETEARENGFYVRADSGIYRYLPPDSIDAHRTTDIYAPFFFPSFGGPYDSTHAVYGNAVKRVYVWVGEGLGHFRPGGKLSLPAQRRIADLSLRGAARGFDFTGEGALSHTDENTFSGLDDANNQGMAFHLSTGYGHSAQRGLFLTSEAEWTDSLFRAFGSGRDVYAYRKRWDLSQFAPPSATSKSVEITGGWKWSGSRVQIEGGALDLPHETAKRGAAEMDLGFAKVGRVQARGEEVLRNAGNRQFRLHRDRVGLRLPQALWGPFAFVGHEWRFNDSLQTGNGYRDIAAGLEPGRHGIFTPRIEAGWRMERDSGENKVFSGADSLRTIRISALLDMERWRGLDFQASAGQRRKTDVRSRNTAIYDVAEFRSTFLPRKRGVDMTTEYMLSATELQAYSDRFQYVGNGLGGYERDSITGDFRPREGGGYEPAGTAPDSGVVGRQIGFKVRLRLIPGRWIKTGGFMDDLTSTTELELNTQRPQQVERLSARYLPDPMLDLIDSSLTVERVRNISQELLFQPSGLPWRARFRVSPKRRESFHYGRETEEGIGYLAGIDRTFGERVSVEMEGKQEQSRRKREAVFAALDYDLLNREIENTIRYSLRRPYVAALGLGGGRSLDRVTDAQYDFYFLSPSLTRNFAEKGRIRAEYTWNQTVGEGILYYQMARGYAKGVTHRWALSGDYKLGENMAFNLFYLGRIESGSSKPFHQANMDLRAFF